MIPYFEKLRKRHQVIFAIIILFAVVSLWRGVWGLMDKYMFPSEPVLSYAISIGIGIFILWSAGVVTRELT